MTSTAKERRTTMIDPEKHDQAFQALHRVLIEARLMGFEGESGEAIADVLDWAELLPTFFRGDRENTGDFRNALKAIADKRPRFGHALRVFDSATPAKSVR
jgi:hypothetical protein